MYQNGGTFRAGRYQWYADHRGTKGDIIYGHFQIAICDEIADQLQNLQIELATAGLGHGSSVVIEAATPLFGVIGRTKYIARAGDKSLDVTKHVDAVGDVIYKKTGKKPDPKDVLTAISSGLNPKGLPKRGSQRWDQLQSIRNRLRNLGPGDTSVRGTNKSLAAINCAEADYLGKSFVGDGYTATADGILKSRDGTRVYRPPTGKPNSPFTNTGKQANFVIRKWNPKKHWDGANKVFKGGWNHVSNGHIDVTD